MKISGNRVLVTGGATGIGFEIARALIEKGNRVLVCGRREEKLREAQERVPALETRVEDIGDEADRNALADWAIERGVNVLVNNAGIQREIDLRRGVQPLLEGDDEIRVNFAAPVYLTALLTPYLMKQPNAAIVNVSSALGFIPLAILPVYCATKAAIHSFTVSLRHQLAETGVRVFEVIPPTVDTGLDRGARARRGQNFRGIPPAEVAAAVLQGMQEERTEIVVGAAARLVASARSDFAQAFETMNARSRAS